MITVVTGANAGELTVATTVPGERTRIRQLSILLLKRQHLAPGSSNASGGEVCAEERIPRQIRDGGGFRAG